MGELRKRAARPRLGWCVGVVCFAAAFLLLSGSLCGNGDEKPPLELAKPEPVTHKLTGKLKDTELEYFGNVLMSAKECKLAGACYYAYLAKHPEAYIPMYNLACVHALLKQADEALYWLQEAARLGKLNTEWAKKDADFEELRKDERFAKVIEYAKKVKAAQKKEDKPYNLICGPKREAKEGEKFPVLLWLHGRGNNPRTVVEGFKLKALAERHGVVIVAPAGPDVYSAGRFTWDSGFEKSFKRIEEALEAAAKKYPIDKDRLITSGFSQGAGVALEVLYKHPKRVAGSVVFCPLAELFLMKPPDGVKGKVALVAREDEKSGFWPQVQETFRKKGGALVDHSITGMSHTLPAEFLTYFESWLLLTLEKMKK